MFYTKGLSAIEGALKLKYLLKISETLQHVSEFKLVVPSVVFFPNVVKKSTYTTVSLVLT